IAGSVAWLTLRPPTYEATSQLLVTPVPEGEQTFLGIQVLRESSGDPTRTVETAATLAESVEAAIRTARALGPGWTYQQVLDDVIVKPQGQSNVLAVTATADTARLAARLANEFARSALAVRGESLQRQAAALIPRLRARRRALPSSSEEAATLTQRLQELDSLEAGGDPTLSLLQQARPPDTRTGIPPALVLLLVALAGFSLGSGAALLREVLERRIRDEEEAVALYPLPVLARLPVLKQRQLRATTGSPWGMPQPVREAFRTLLAQLGQRNGGRVVMVASASTGDGKTTSAINLAAAIAATGDRVVLLDLDLRKPEVGRSLGMQDTTALTRLLEPDVKLADLLVPAPGLPAMSILATTVPFEHSAVVEAVNRRLPELIQEAKSEADWVVLDTAPLGEVSDALGLADSVDDIIVVTRPGHTNRASFEVMRGLLERTMRRDATGLLVIANVEAMPGGYDYGLDNRPQQGRRRPLSRARLG
ncbi:MAG: P-loop NTPase, partial [Actinomycetota bacterium]|nr:P-loop NTPase [Actinomycetota bacterium]